MLRETSLTLHESVRLEVERRFRARDRDAAIGVLEPLEMPFLQAPDRTVDRARVQVAVVRLSGGDLGVLARAAKRATIDWRDVLVAAGLANADWRDVLEGEGIVIREDPGGAT